MTAARDRASRQPAAVASRPLADNVAAVAAIEQAALASRSLAERLADGIARAAGSGTCVLLHVAWFGAWILVNVGILPVARVFDPFPSAF